MKQDAKSRIIRHLTKADIVLTAEEELLLIRWEKADFFMRQGMEYADIVLKLTGIYQVTRSTADNYIAAAQFVFGRSRKLNKQYLAHLHLEAINQDMKNIRKGLFQYEDEETGEKISRTPDAKEIAALAKLHDSYTRQLAAIPEDTDIQEAPKPVIMYQLPGEEQAQLPMQIAQALQIGDALIAQAEDIDYEEIKDEEDDEPDDGQ